jgi:2-aminobenzoate-CoA ligase
MTSIQTTHVDTFVVDNLPAVEDQPEFLFSSPELVFPERLNCATELLDNKLKAGLGEKIVFYTPNEAWTYRNLYEKANQIAHVLTTDLQIVPGNRILLRSPNNVMMVACWFGALKAGAVVVATMTLLRAKELVPVIEKGHIALALCDRRVADELEKAGQTSSVLKRICYFDGSGTPGGGAELEELMKTKPTVFDNVPTYSHDPALIGFTSGTTGVPKGTIHYHRDVMAMCICFSDHVLKPSQEDLFIGSPPIAFTFGLGTLVTFPMHAGAASVLLEQAGPDQLIRQIERFRATICCTAPTAYKAMLNSIDSVDLSSLKKCVSAGENLPLPVFTAWRQATGIQIINGIGSTEMIHIFISAADGDIRPGSTGKPIFGYQACVVDENMNLLPPGQKGMLAVKGPTGCRYLADARQKDYVKKGWNVTGDVFEMDADGYFWFQARGDDMIISAGYNIGGPEVEGTLLDHPAVEECAVVAWPDEERGSIVKAYIVLPEGREASDLLVKELQDFVKQHAAPYKYPRAIEFLKALPKTETGKIQRFKLRAENYRKDLGN